MEAKYLRNTVTNHAAKFAEKLKLFYEDLRKIRWPVDTEHIKNNSNGLSRKLEKQQSYEIIVYSKRTYGHVS